MIRFGGIVGQDAPIAILRDAAASGRLHHALVFVGPEGVGKRTTALALAAFLLCRARGEDACGECPPCRQVAAGSHPDVHFESLAGDRKKVSIDQVRELTVALGQRALAGGKKVAIVDDADDLTDDAQNAFLKTLEEPPGDSLIVLVAHSAAKLLPTVRSRCQRVAFRPLAEAALEEVLCARGRSPEDARLLAAYAQGSLGIALDADPARVRAAIAEIDELLARASSGRARDAIAAGQATVPRKPPKESSAAERRREPQPLDVLLERLRADLRAAAGAPGGGGLTARGKTGSVSEALLRAAAAYQAVVDLDRNAHAALAVERLWLELGRS